MIANGRLLNQVHKELNLDDMEDDDLVRVDEVSNIEKKVHSIMAQWNWNSKDYFILNKL